MDTFGYTMMIYEIIDTLSPWILVGVAQVMSIEERLRNEVVKLTHCNYISNKMKELLIISN